MWPHPMKGGGTARGGGAARSVSAAAGRVGTRTAQTVRLPTRPGRLGSGREHDPRRHRQAGPRRPRPRREGHRPRPPRRRHGGHLHGAPPDARADRRDGDPGGCRRGRHLHPLGRAHDARAAHPRLAPRARRRRRAGRARRHDPRPTTSRSSRPRGVAEVFTPGAPTGDIVDFLRSRLAAPTSAT